MILRVALTVTKWLPEDAQCRYSVSDSALWEALTTLDSCLSDDPAVSPFCHMYWCQAGRTTLERR